MLHEYNELHKIRPINFSERTIFDISNLIGKYGDADFFFASFNSTTN